MRIRILLPLCGLLFISASCSPLEVSAPAPLIPEPTQVMAVQYHEHALYNFQFGRRYMAENRYELAREHFLLALASAEDDTLRRNAVMELETVNRLIRSQR